MRRILRVVGGLAVLLSTFWLGGWWFAQQRLKQSFRNWEAELRDAGWTIRHRPLASGFSPTQASLTIPDLRLSFTPPGRTEPFGLHLTAVTVRVSALAPLVLRLDLPPSLSVFTAGSEAAVIRLGSSNIRDFLRPGALFRPQQFPFRGGSLEARDIEVLPGDGSLDLVLLRIGSLHDDFALDPQAGGASDALATEERLSGLELPRLFTAMFSLPFGGRVESLSLSLHLSGPVPAPFLEPRELTERLLTLPNPATRLRLIVPYVQEWANGGGHGRLKLGLTVGPLKATAAVSVHFEPPAQPAATLVIEADGVTEFLAALGKDYPSEAERFAALAAELKPYLGKNAQGRSHLHLVMTLAQGVISLNGKPGLRLPLLPRTEL